MSASAHLSPVEILDAAESRGSERATAHLASCPACAAEAARARDTLSLARTDDVPEPSPLFWDHFQTRVQAAIDAEPGRPQAAWAAAWRTWGRLAAAAAAVVLVVGAAMIGGGWPPDPGRGSGQDRRDVSGASPVAADASRLEDGAFDLVAVISSDLADDADAAGGIDPVPGTADRAVEQLSSEERGTLIQLLEAEIGRRPS